MVYESTITFTMDTICPWTYLAFLRLRTALNAYTTSHPSSPATFTLHLAPYQLYPDFPATASKHKWYTSNRYNDDPAKTDAYVEAMRQLGEKEGRAFRVGDGEMGNTLQALRVLMLVQEDLGPEKACALLAQLYEAYFENAQHPSTQSTLLQACTSAGISESEARRIVEDESEGLMEVKSAIREQAGNGVDSVPSVVFEGRKRDFGLVGAREVAEYVSTMEQVAKECT